MDESMTESLGARLDRLERRGRWLLVLALSLVIGLLVLVVEGTDLLRTTPRVVQAEQFVLRDEEGLVRAELTLGLNDVPILALYNEFGREQAVLRGSDFDGGVLYLYDQGKPRLVLAPESEGSASIALLDDRQDEVARLALDPNGRVPLQRFEQFKGRILGDVDFGDELTPQLLLVLRRDSIPNADLSTSADPRHKRLLAPSQSTVN